ncbi:AAA family ATPase [Larsenimonas rhizosphaerae]|uniref:AAA family ATPase n=1 Tax=Larsenimonas rhizosphaerae TaxID=2944682 RepID=UPI0020334194|nr:AAA family ATPase [Larsenimonas rhizosphaerae]MCM2131461.1 AAA family ATPase [Larsenimonas rhizosphaerae]
MPIFIENSVFGGGESMIAGLFLRNIKCYGNLHFLPFTKDIGDNINIFIGDNGVGKSTVLSSLDCIMNNINPKDWETTLGQKKDRAHICPVFLIEKDSIKQDDQIEAISSFFWNYDMSKVNQSDSTELFVEWRDDLKSKIDIDKYYLVAIGKNYEGGVILTSTFDKTVFNNTKRHGVSKEYIFNLFKRIVSNYSYIYIPVESRIDDVLSMQANEMQSLMDRSIVDEIRDLFCKREHVKDNDNKRSSITDLINGKLGSYVDDINNKLSDGYKFEPKAHKKTIKPNDIVKVVLSEYFSIRPLTKDGKNIDSLSSGQQRLALIDVATTLLSSNAKKSKKVVLAIDEPESSLEAAQRFRQFNRLVGIAEKYSNQIFLTTHWYGLLLRPSKGRLHYIEEKSLIPAVKDYSMESFFDSRRSFPNSFEMKSYFDLMSSMLSILKSQEENWIICEGAEDASYLSLYLSDRIQRLHILPFNGCGNVRKLFEFLAVPFSDNDESKRILGKVLCLIDTDAKSTVIVDGYNAGKFNSKLGFKRWGFNRENNKVTTISVASHFSVNTEIEDVLEASVAWEALTNLSKSDAEFEAILSCYQFNPDVTYTDFTGEMAMFECNDVESYEKKPRLKEFLASDEIKGLFSKEYKKSFLDRKEYAQIEWVDEIAGFFDK